MNIKRTIASKCVGEFNLDTSSLETHSIKAGDLGVFEIIEPGQHTSVQMTDGRNHSIFPGDLILASFADRYATSQFEGYIPKAPMSEYHIIGGGGVIGIVHSKNYALKDIEPTTVRQVGYCTDAQQKIINTKFFQTERKSFRGDVPAKIILSVGSTMDSGKTTTAAFVSRGLKRAFNNVAFVKLTGTCHTKDREFVKDCGADIVADFSDVGYPSTYMCSKDEILDVFQTLMDKLALLKPDVIVMEIADGLLQRETSFLLQDKPFMSCINKVIFSCGDSLSAFQGVQLLGEWGIPVSAVSGYFTTSPLLIEEVKSDLAVPVFTIDEVMTGSQNHLFI
jgi:hypothetical protein